MQNHFDVRLSLKGLEDLLGIGFHKVNRLSRKYFNRGSCYLIITSKGSGVQTFAARCQIRSGQLLLNEKDISGLFRSRTASVATHELGFYMPIIYAMSTGYIVTTYDDMLINYAHKTGASVIGVALKGVMIRDLELTLTRWPEIADYLSNPAHIAGGHHNKFSELDSRRYSLKSQRGHYIRRNIMLYAKTLGLCYIGMGDEHESVDDANTMQVSSKHYGDYKYDYELSCATSLPWISYIVPEGPRRGINEYIKGKWTDIVIIVAPSGSGKSYYAKQGKWLDGDEIVFRAGGWPKEESFWLLPPDSYVNLVNGQRILAFDVMNNALDIIYNSGVTGLVAFAHTDLRFTSFGLDVGVDQYTSNMISRAGNTKQPDSLVYIEQLESFKLKYPWVPWFNTVEDLFKEYSGVNCLNLYPDGKMLVSTGKSTADGQRKLLSVELAFVRRHQGVVLVYLGGSPGHHLKRIHGYKRIIIVDPREPDFDIKHMTWMKRFVTKDQVWPNENFIVINDIRRDYTHWEEHENNIIDDNILNKDLILSAFRTGRCKAFLAKYRPAAWQKEDTILTPDSLIRQPWIKHNSEEVRLYYTTLNGETILNCKNFRARCIISNIKRTFNSDRKLERGLLSLAVRSHDIRRDVREVGLKVWLWSSSNIRNAPFDWVKSITGPRIFTFPNVNRRKLVEGFDKVGETVLWTEDRESKDVAVDQSFNRHNVNMYMMLDLLAYFRSIHKQDLDTSYVLTDPYLTAWDFWVNDLPNMNIYQQTWWESQTQWARWMSTRMRIGWQMLGEKSIYTLRKFAMLQGGAELINSDPMNEITGYDRRLDAYISPSGHLMNLLVAGSYGLIDFNRYMATIYNNITSHYWGRFNETTKLYKEGLLAESNSEEQILWHSWTDLFYAMLSYLYLCKLTKIKINIRNFVVVCRWMSKLEKTSRKLKECTRANHFRKRGVTIKS